MFSWQLPQLQFRNAVSTSSDDDIDREHETELSRSFRLRSITKHEKNLDESATMIEATVIDEGTDSCGEQSIALRNTDTGYQVLWSAVNNGTKVWDGYSLVKADSNPSVTTASNTIAVPTTAPGEKAEVSFDINIDSTAASTDPLWMEYYIDAGSRGFCEFYFEAPAK